MNVQLKTKPAFKFVGYELKTSCIDGRNHREIPLFWRTYLDENKGAHIGNRVQADSQVELGICTDFNPQTSDLTYLIGMEVTTFDGVLEDQVCREFPEATYAVFTTPPVKVEEFTSAIQSTWKSIQPEWFPTSGYTHAGGAEFELYDERCNPAKNELVEMDIYIPVKKK
ncbi:GyrI-like domain-containing protein [Paenibacillus sp. HWE-109]|uniref:GyrI-like domain-containing protein n=1 Tax=Paenibacillus sp. HWE-109 TaxID=1306526 RepID=UPI001EDF104A|nr:GyrI-like domain-containing protein [Paenibacillus sp. HWE-109]UKS25405.1 GyrI-like domain-containing protein [Paenibacillus sp. HWE-109]